MAYSSARRRYAFVGIDPGTTLGVAMIDLEGNPIEVFSTKNYSISDAVARIISSGKPLIVASDVTPTPSMVKRISSIFSSPVLELDESLSTEEKIALTKGEGYEYNNAHERDALAACVHALRRYKKKFSQVQKKTPAEVNVEEVKALVVRGISISAAINRLVSANGEEKAVKTEERQEERKDSYVSDDAFRLHRVIKGKDERIAMLEGAMTALEAQVEEKDRIIHRLRYKLDSMKSENKKEITAMAEMTKRDKEIKRLRAVVAEIEGRNKELKKIIEELKGTREVKGGRRIKVIKSFSQEAIVDTDRQYGFKKGDVVFLEDSSGGGASTAALLAKKGVSAVIHDKELSHFAANTFIEFDIPTFSTDEVPLLLKEEDGDFAFVDQHVLSEKTEDWKRERKRREVILLR